jgi:hypothetical protein
MPTSSDRRQPAPIRRSRAPVLCFALTCLAACLLRAHPISLTSALINVNDDRITVELGMMVEDLVLYYDIEPGENQRYQRAAIIERAQAHREFLLRYFHLRDGDGLRLNGEILEIDLSEVGDDGIASDELMAHTIAYRLEYPLASKPDYLTIAQDFGGNEPVVPAEMEVRIFQDGARLGSAVLLSHRSAHTVRLEWDAGGRDGAGDLEAARRSLAERREDAFGIISYSSVYSFIYITDTEVRHEILIPLLTLETWLPMHRKDSSFMTVEEQKAARATVFEFLARCNRVAIDGTPVAPVLTRLDFFGPDFRDFARRAPERQVSVYNARVGVVLSFPAQDTPRQVRFEWDYFDERLTFLRPAVFAFDQPGQDALFDFYQTTFIWNNDRPSDPPAIAPLAAPEPPPRLHLPVWSLLAGAAAMIMAGVGLRSGPLRRRITYAALASGLVAGGLATLPYGIVAIPHPFRTPPAIDGEKATAIFRALHHDAYRAFGQRTEARVYDVLERSIAGQLLEDFYLQIRRTLQAEEEGGTVSRIDAVEILDGSPRPAAGSSPEHQAFEYQCAWTVTGSVEHWGHIHTRKNQYEAIFTVEGLPSGWKITGFEPLREEQLQTRIGLRR